MFRQPCLYISLTQSNIIIFIHMIIYIYIYINLYTYIDIYYDITKHGIPRYDIRFGS